MRIAVAHLDGARRGVAEMPAGEVLRIGSMPEAEIRIDGALPDHATLDLREGAALLEARGPVRVNRARVRRARLEDGDLVEFGGAATLRFRLLDADGAALPRQTRAAARFTPGGLFLALVIGVLATSVVAVALGVTQLAGSTERASAASAEEARRQRALWERERERYEARIGDLERDLRGLGTRAEMEARMGEVRRAVAEVESAVLERVDTEVARSLGAHPDLKAARDAVKRFERDDSGVAGVIARAAPAVCLIQGSYGFGREVDGQWRFLREASKEILEEIELSPEKIPLVLEGEGEVFTVDYTGTGFLVDSRGVVLTNRHIAEPWWRNDAAEPLLRDGFEPRFLFLRACFPGRESAVCFDRAATSVLEECDLAALRFTPEGPLPEPLPLAPAGEAVVGRRVLLLGYPSGLNALLARAEEEFADSMTRGEGVEPAAMLDALAKRGMVRPLPTQGHICDVGQEKIVFDAPTAGGGSGAPLIDMQGRVLAVNYGILKAFSGANFGVPIHRAGPLLR